jgi:spermidine synthase
MNEKKIKDTIIHWCRDEYGEIAVTADGDIRSLYFGDGILQSRIRLDRPDALIDEYNHAMMSALVFRDSPKSVLLIGLGGCSLVNFMVNAFPGCAVDVVEVRKQVIEIASDFFLAYKGHPDLKIFHAAGEDFLRQRGAGRRSYDLIFVDAFDDEGPAAGLLDIRFLRDCRLRLNEWGVFAINLWTRPEDNFPFLYNMVREAFEANALKLCLGEAYENAIVFGLDKPLCRDLPSYRQHARKLQERYSINFPKYLKYLYWQNSG